MMRSLFSAVSGLRNHQTRMDIIGNNIANVNTPGFKASRATFAELFAQTLRSATRPEEEVRGGLNPMQIGLGSTLASFDVVDTPGSLQTTGRPTDLAVSGEGFLVLGGDGSQRYSRSAALNVDASGYLIHPSGLRVLGWAAGADGSIDTLAALQPVRVPRGEHIDPAATTRVRLNGNLSADASIGDEVVVPVMVYDGKGSAHALTVTLTRRDGGAGQPANAWDFVVGGPAELTFSGDTTGTVSFKDEDGSFESSGATPLEIDVAGPDGASFTFTLDFDGLNQQAGISLAIMDDSLTAAEKGYAGGEFEGFALDTAGVLTARFSNGLTRSTAQVALAQFANSGGLLREGSVYASSNNSGEPALGAAGTGSRGQLVSGALEMSNVDLAQEFTDMIVTERGFQANARVVTVSDEMLQELANLKR